MNYENIFLYEEKFKVTVQELLDLFPGKKIYICDFYLEDSEKGRRIPGGFEYKGITCIDHHFPIPAMEKIISSTILAAEYIKEFGTAPKDSVVIIHHTDTDSILSSAILTGLLKPEKIFFDAAIAADHTGEPNKIADLLQYCQRLHDIKFSFKNLLFLLAGKKIEEKAFNLMEERIFDRQEAKRMMEAGQVKMVGEVALVEVNKKVDSVLFPALLPKAKVIVVARQHENSTNKWIIKVRLGTNVPQGFTLRKIMKGLDPNYGGRWNAGNNKRGGGTNISPPKYVKMINESIQKYSRIMGSGIKVAH